MQDFWAQVDQENVEKLKAALEMRRQDPDGRGLLVVQNQFGTIVRTSLEHHIPRDTILFHREDVNLDGLVPTSTEGGRGT